MWFTAKRFDKTDLLFTFDHCSWALPLHVSWLYITKKELPELTNSFFVFELRILCITFRIEYN